MFADCIAKRRRVLGEDHPDTLGSLNNLAFLYKSQGQYDKAEPLYVDCLAKRQRVLGDRHPHTVMTRSNLTVLREESLLGRNASILNKKL